MNATHSRARVASNPTPTIDIFRARCEARALLYSVGELDLHEAVDELQAVALAGGLVADIGQDGIQQIMANAFDGRVS